MGYTKYNLRYGRQIVIIQDAVIGEPQVSLVQYVIEMVEEKGIETGEFVEGRWFTIPSIEVLGEQISAILNQDKRIKITIHGDEIISDRENVE